jgi:polar amino acid transport system permease protein
VNDASTPPLSDAELRALLHRANPLARRDVQRSLVIAVLSTIVVFLVLWWAVSGTQGWEAVQASFLSWEDFRASMPKVWEGFKLNVRIFLIAEPIVLILGLLLAILRGITNPVLFPIRALAIAYIDLFRGIPALLVILLLGFGIPGLRIESLPNSPIIWGTLGCILTSSAYTAETFRAGIESVHPSQRAAARSLGLTGAQTFTYVVLPQGVRRVIPPLLSGFISLQKETALVSTLGLLDATRQAQIYSGTKFNYTSYLAAAALYIAITIPLTRITDYLVMRSQRDRDVGGRT